ncbi:MAG: hypothetical protein WC789_05225 [Lentisphaeria bacterium]|jgi:hypothetical protein
MAGNLLLICCHPPAREKGAGAGHEASFFLFVFLCGFPRLIAEGFLQQACPKADIVLDLRGRDGERRRRNPFAATRPRRKARPWLPTLAALRPKLERQPTQTPAAPIKIGITQ